MELSIVEQSLRMRTLYTQLCLCYPTPDAVSKELVVKASTSGLERLTATFPWLAGQVIHEREREDAPGIPKVIPFEKIPLLVLRNIENNSAAPTMAALREANFPFSMLDEKLICPRTTLPEGSSVATPDLAPVFLIQANFITGGVLLCFLASHSTMDIVGQTQIIRLLSKACRDEAFTADEITNGNLDRRKLFPILDDLRQPDSKSDFQPEQPPYSQPPSTPGNDPPSSTTSPLTWAYITFSSTSLQALKAHVTSTLPPPSSSHPTPTPTPPYISTDDALCTLLWHSIARSRFSRLPPTTTTVFTRAVDMRLHLAIPHSYPGNVVTKTYSSSTLQALSDQPLDHIASHLRSQLDPPTLKHHFLTETQTQRLTNMKPKPTTSGTDRTTTIVMSSWTKLGLWECDFGLGLGGPERVRRPRFEGTEGVVYLLPETRGRGVVAGLCLRGDDMEGVRDGVRAFGGWVG